MKYLLFFIFLIGFIQPAEPVGKDDGVSMKTPEPEVHTLTNPQGNTVTITNYGGKVMAIRVPDKNGHRGNVVLGYDTAGEYPEGNPYFGALIGRYANRIAGGRFVLEGREYRLARNNGKNHLHGGPGGFHNVYWKTRRLDTARREGLELSYVSPDGEEGYPGRLRVRVRYLWDPTNSLRIEYSAVTDKPTVINLTHHSFFNLRDGGKSSIIGHLLMIQADGFTPVNAELIPTGQILPVDNTPMDFRIYTPMGRRIDEDFPQLQYGRGYDHNYVLDHEKDTIALAARVYEPESGRVMEVYTDQPGLQFYSGNFLDGSDQGIGGIRYRHRSAFCLEAQHYPDSPNHPRFPTTTLRPGETYRQVTIYKFYTAEKPPR